MPRANRYILPGGIYHVTHRCHNKSHLFRFAHDRNEYKRRLRENMQEYGVKVLNYCITCNHVHLLVTTDDSKAVSNFMQKQEGAFAEYYNIRKQRSGAFWGGRYNCTMVDSGEYVLNCMRYIDLNMVRAGEVSHPADWGWCGYREIMGKRRRYTLIDIEEVLKRLERSGFCSLEEFRSQYELFVHRALERGALKREDIWTESIAVGSEDFVREIESKTQNRIEYEIEESTPRQWTIKEKVAAYS